jgi:hypothetical protein
MKDRSRISMFSNSIFTGRIFLKREDWTNYGVKNTFTKIDKKKKVF